MCIKVSDFGRIYVQIVIVVVFIDIKSWAIWFFFWGIDLSILCPNYCCNTFLFSNAYYVCLFAGMFFLSYMVEDKTPGGLSYVEFLVHVHRQIQTKIAWGDRILCLCYFWYEAMRSFIYFKYGPNLEMARWEAG